VTGQSGGRTVGLSVLNDSRYAYDALDGELRLSILRSPPYAFHRPRRIEPGVIYDYTDQGAQVVRLALVPHDVGWIAETVRRAEELNVPPIACEVEAHAGDWPAAASLVRCSAPNVTLSALKLAEEGDDLILRGYETAGRATEAEVAVGFERAAIAQAVRWRPHEIVTLRVQRDPPRMVRVNMLEEADAEGMGSMGRGESV